MEIWKDIKNYEGLYQVSNLGKIKSIDRMVNCKDNYSKKILGRYLCFTQDKDGYLMCSLWKKNKGQTVKVHRVVCSSFKENIESKPQVNHIDGDKKNNNIENLEWVNNSENNKHAYKIGLKKPCQKKAVYVYNLNMDLLFSFDNIHEASRVTNVDRSNLTKVCKGEFKQCKGLIFKYKN